MFEAGLAVLISAAMGAALGLPRSGSLRRFTPAVQTFALSAGVAVVVLHLLPAALEGLGISALLLLLAGLLLPSLLARIFRGADLGDHDADDAVSLELGYLGLLLHKLGDGVVLGTLTANEHGEHDHFALIVAIAAHAVPVTALVMLAFVRRHGVSSGVFRCVGLAAAALLGLAATSAVPVAVVHAVQPYIAGLTGGLLLHVIGHDWQAERPRTTGLRLADLAAMVLGVALCTVGGHGHAHQADHVEHVDHVGHVGHANPVEHADIGQELGHAFLELFLETAPILLLGLMVGALLQTYGARIPASFLRGGRTTLQALKGAVLGAPLPVCACGVLPIADGLRARRASTALVIAFLLATPELGVETLGLTARFMGWPFAIVRVAAALAVAIVAALLVARTQTPSSADLEGEGSIGMDADGGQWSQLLAYFDELLYHTGPWTLVGLFAAACVQVTLPAQAMQGWGSWGGDVLLVSLIAIPSYVCAAAATPLGAVLLGKGFSVGAVLAGLLLGPATNVATVAFLRRAYGAKAMWAAVVGVLGTTWVIAAMVNASGIAIELRVVEEDGHAHGPWVWLATAVLGGFVLRAVWRDGIRAWLAAVGEAFGGHGHDHDHGHDLVSEPGEPGEDGDGGKHARASHGHGAGHGNGHAHGDTQHTRSGD